MLRHNKKKTRYVRRKKLKPPIVWDDLSNRFQESALDIATRSELENEVSQYLPRVLSELVGATANEFCGKLVSVGECRGWSSLFFNEQTKRFLIVVRDASLYRFLVGTSPKDIREVYYGKTHSYLEQIEFFGDFVCLVDKNRLECLCLSTGKWTVQKLNFLPKHLAVMQSRYLIASATRACCVFDVHTSQVDELFTLNLSLRMAEHALVGHVSTVGDFLVARNAADEMVVLRGRECENWFEAADQKQWINSKLVTMGSDFIVGSDITGYKESCLSVLRLSDRALWTFDYDRAFCERPSNYPPYRWCAACLIENGSAFAVSIHGWYFVFDLATGQAKAEMFPDSTLARALVPWIDQTTVLVKTARFGDGPSFCIWDTVACTITELGEELQWTGFERIEVAPNGTAVVSSASTLLVFQ